MEGRAVAEGQNHVEVDLDIDERRDGCYLWGDTW